MVHIVSDKGHLVSQGGSSEQQIEILDQVSLTPQKRLYYTEVARRFYTDIDKVNPTHEIVNCPMIGDRLGGPFGAIA